MPTREPKPGAFALALLLFHWKVGVRVALLSSAPLFAFLVALVMLQVDPAAAVRALAGGVFGASPSPVLLGAVGALALVLTSWAGRRVALGLHGWIRHLAADGRAHRRAMTAGMAAVLSPLFASLLLLWFVAVRAGHEPGFATWGRLLLVLASASFASVPAARRLVTLPLSLASLLVACAAPASWLPFSLLLLAAVELFSGPLQAARRSTAPWKVGWQPFALRIAWRATRWRITGSYAKALLVFGATALFVSNNALAGPIRSGTFRFGAILSLGVLLASAAGHLSERRPVWPWVRSLPSSASQRVAEDCAFLGLCAVPLLLVITTFEPRSGLESAAALTLLGVRACSLVRQWPGRRSGPAPYLGEVFAVASFSALLPWTLPLWPPASVAGFFAARRLERDLRATAWLERSHDPAGDPFSWSSG